MRTYVLGFLFDDALTAVALLRKQVQAGGLNGLGGQVNRGEQLAAAMAREAAEEVACPPVHWEHIAVIDFAAWNGKGRVSVNVFTGTADLAKLRAQEDEPLHVVELRKLQQHHLVRGVLTLVNVCLERRGQRLKPVTVRW